MSSLAGLATGGDARRKDGGDDLEISMVPGVVGVRLRWPRVMPTAIYFQMDGGETGVSVFTFIACAVAWASLGLPRPISRWISLVVAGLFASIKAGSVWEYVVGDTVMAFLVNQAWGLVGTLLIIWYAWTWPSPREG